MPTWYTAKKRSKWWNAYKRLSTTASSRHLKSNWKFRRTFAKREQIYKNFEKWRYRNEIFGYDWGHPAYFYFNKSLRRKVFEYCDSGYESDFPSFYDYYD